MRRVISLWLPTWPTDRLRRTGVGPADDAPLVVARHDGRLQTIVAVDSTAFGLGVRSGMALAGARALVPGLVVCPATPEADTAALGRLAAWCMRYAPLVAIDPPDGLWIDITGGAHLHGGETLLLHDLLSRLVGQGLGAKAAVADTPGAAHAMARFGADPLTVVPPRCQAVALAPLPPDALRLPPDVVEGLRLMGFERVEKLAAAARAPLVRRFGTVLARRLDQALGEVGEPIVPLVPPELIQARLAFVEPLLTAEAFSTVIARLLEKVCADLESAGLGANRWDLLFERVDGSVQALRVGTARPSRDPRHLASMLNERLERIDPGLGIEAMHLLTPRTDRMPGTQTVARLADTEQEDRDIAPLVDRLANRLGTGRVYRLVPVESDVPERAVRKDHGPLVPPKPARSGRREKGPAGNEPAGNGREAGALRSGWPADLPRPVRLLDPPQPVEAMALLPDHPPVAFTWRRVRHRIRHADGPERIAGEWWKRDGEVRAVRDYFRVEDEEGRRFWLFRRGDGNDRLTGDMRWFLHGFF